MSASSNVVLGRKTFLKCFLGETAEMGPILAGRASSKLQEFNGAIFAMRNRAAGVRTITLAYLDSYARNGNGRPDKVAGWL
jgi:hypothetical protein